MVVYLSNSKTDILVSITTRVVGKGMVTHMDSYTRAAISYLLQKTQFSIVWPEVTGKGNISMKSYTFIENLGKDFASLMELHKKCWSRLILILPILIREIRKLPPKENALKDGLSDQEMRIVDKFCLLLVG